MSSELTDERLEELRVEIIRATLRVRAAIAAKRETIAKLRAMNTQLSDLVANLER
jgi:cell division protein FtsB